MAGVGFDPSDFALFEIDDPEERGAALETSLLPKLVSLGNGCLPGLSRVAGQELHLHAARIHHRRESPPEEVLVAFSESPRGYRGLPFLEEETLAHEIGNAVEEPIDPLKPEVGHSDLVAVRESESHPVGPEAVRLLGVPLQSGQLPIALSRFHAELAIIGPWSLVLGP